MRSPTLRALAPRALSPLRALALALLAAGCAGSARGGAGADGERLRVSVVDYASGQHFELASESHTDRVAYYSAERADAARKVQTDEVMGLLVAELERQGFERYAQAGRAPTRGGGAVTRSIEVEDDGALEHWVIGAGSAPDERRAFNECLGQFLDLYNLSASYQSVDNPLGDEFFRKQESAAAAANGR